LQQEYDKLKQKYDYSNQNNAEEIVKLKKKIHVLSEKNKKLNTNNLLQQ